MIKRILFALTLLVCLCPLAMANQEYEINLAQDPEHAVKSVRLGELGYITFQYLSKNGNTAYVQITIDNQTQQHPTPVAFILFKKEYHEKALKSNTPKIVFEKTYPGTKGNISVNGFQSLKGLIDIIPTGENEVVSTIEVPFTSPKDLTIPLYIATYKLRDLQKKGKDNVSYKIREELTFSFHLAVKGWSEEDPTYVRLKEEVDHYNASLAGVNFCPNPKHKPSLAEQQQSYVEKRDSLRAEIEQLMKNEGWMTVDKPYEAYTKLIEELDKVNLNTLKVDCNNHKSKKPYPKPDRPSCSNCSLTEQQIYHRLDDLLQSLNRGRVSKDQAVKSARSLFNCYQQHKSRNKSGTYGTKINNYYNKIVNY